MARSTDPATAPIYALHHRWLSDVLPSGGSLFAPGQPIWTTENLDELQREFVEKPDVTTGKSYLDKLRDQLASTSDPARQLMAELHAVHFLSISTSAISASKKIADLRAILSWMATPADVPPDVEAAMSRGLARPGQWALTRRDTQINWLIAFSRTIKAQTGGAPDDPWAMQTLAQSVSSPSAEAARLALLHQAFPDTFEQCVSVAHKQLMVRRFRELANSPDDIDRQLLDIRSALSQEHGKGFDFYAEPLYHQWWRSGAWKGFMAWLERFRALPNFDAAERSYKIHLGKRLAAVRQHALSDDDGWRAELRSVLNDRANNLTPWRMDEPFLKWLNGDPAASVGSLRLLWAPAGSASERIDGFLSGGVGTVLEQPGQQLNMSTFLLMGVEPTTYPPAKITVFEKAWHLSGFGPAAPGSSVAAKYDGILAFLDELVHDSRDWTLPLRDRLDAQGAVWSLVRWKSSKSGIPPAWSDDDWRRFDRWRDTEPEADDEDDPEQPDAIADIDPDPDPDEVFDHIAAAADELSVDRSVLDEIVQLLEDKRQVILYGPPGTGKTYLGLRLGRAIAEGDESRVSVVQFHPATTYEDFFEGLRPHLTESGQVSYRLTSGPLVEIVNRARNDATHTYVMLIDEVNRANLPKVFGELLFLLEYRDESAQVLYRPTERFELPPNLWFIGTMNTADRSVALIDAAMRRRFHFVPFFPHEGAMRPLLRQWLTKRRLPVRIADFLDAVNEALIDRLGDHLLIGPSHFMKSDLSEPALERIWTYNIFPLLEEQLWGQRDEIAQWRWPEVRKRYVPQLTGRSEEPSEQGVSTGAVDDASPTPDADAS